MRSNSKSPVQKPFRRKPLRDVAEARRQSIVESLTSAGQATVSELHKRLGEPEHAIRYAMSLLVKQERSHVAGWDLVALMHYEMSVPRYAAGPGRNVPPPLSAQAFRRQHKSALDFNPGADLQAVTVLWGQSTMQENHHAEE